LRAAAAFSVIPDSEARSGNSFLHVDVDLAHGHAG
jgi:hypothetical protein